MTDEQREALPCPFCGSPYVSRFGDLCMSCGATGPRKGHEPHTWNTRPIERAVERATLVKIRDNCIEQYNDAMIESGHIPIGDTTLSEANEWMVNWVNREIAALDGEEERPR